MYAEICRTCGKRNAKREPGIFAVVEGRKRWFCCDDCLKRGKEYAERKGGECENCRDRVEELADKYCKRCQQELGTSDSEFVSG